MEPLAENFIAKMQRLSKPICALGLKQNKKAYDDIICKFDDGKG